MEDKELLVEIGRIFDQVKNREPPVTEKERHDALDQMLKAVCKWLFSREARLLLEEIPKPENHRIN